MRRWERIGDLPPIDLAAADILRSRETGVPRYTRVPAAAAPARPAPPSRSSPAATRTRAAAIREVYDGNLDAVDAVVGLYAEPKPQGFAFSETAFRIFLLMAARRLQSDRFFTDDYTPETYTPEGLALDRGDDDGRRHPPHLPAADAAGRTRSCIWPTEFA